MALTLKHAFQSAKTDGADSTLVQPSNWNANHTLTGSNNILFGTNGTGTGGEITVSTGLSLSASTLTVAIGTSVQAWDGDLDAIAALAGTSGYLKKTAANTWTLDTSTYQQQIATTGILKGSGSGVLSAAVAGTDYLAPAAIGSTVQAWDADLDTWATKTAPSGTVVGTSDTQTLTNKTLTTPRLSGSSSGYTEFASANSSSSNYTVTFPAENMTVGYRNIPAVGTKTSSYTLAVSDVGKYVQLGTSGAITIPNSTFAEGDVVTLFNNTTGNITITCSTTNAYIAGTNTNKTSMTLATRGVATILFISATLCVVSGNVS